MDNVDKAGWREDRAVHIALFFSLFLKMHDALPSGSPQCCTVSGCLLMLVAFMVQFS